MVIDRVRIEKFGALCEKEITFSRGVNIIEGENESGKTTIAAFIRFMFYGFPEREDAERYLAFSGNTAAGELDCTADFRNAGEISYRITRTLSENADEVLIRRMDTGEEVFSGEVPGEVFFGVNAALFTSTVFVRQIGAGGGENDSTAVKPSTVRDAVANILNTGCENTDLDTALDRLQKQKDALYDPETKRGAIYDMEKQRAALAARLEMAKDTMPDVEALRAGIAECEGRIAEHNERSDKLKLCLNRCHEYESLGSTDRLNELIERRTSALRQTKELCDAMFRGSYIPDGDYVDALRQCGEKMQTAEDERKEAEIALKKLTFNASRDNIKEDLLRRVEIDGGVDEINDFIRGRRMKRTVATTCGIVFLIPAVLATVTTGIILYLGADILKLCLIISALLWTLTVFFFLCRVRYNRDLKTLCARYGCETEDELENFLEEYGVLQSRFHHDTEERENLRLKIAECERNSAEGAQQAAELLSRLQPDGFPEISPERVSVSTVHTAADRIAGALNELGSLLERADASNDEILSLVRENGIEADNAEEAAELWEKRYRELYTFFDGRAYRELDTDILLRELDFNQKTNRALEQKIAGMRAELEKLLHTDCSHVDVSPLSETDPKAIAEALASLDERLVRERRTYTALNLAAETMKTAAEHLRTSLAPSLTAHAAELLCRLTDRKGQALELDCEDRLICKRAEGSTSFPVEYLSAGTQNLAYLSLRLSLIRRLYTKNLPPLLFDEAFVTLDDRRLSRMVALLFEDADAENGENGIQALIFTCHRREREAAEAVKDCHVIRLGVQSACGS